MSLVASQHHFTHQSHSTATGDDPKSPPDHTEAALSSLLGAYTNADQNPMDRSGASEFPQSGLHSSYPHALTNAQSEESTADTPSAPQYPSQAEVKPSPNQAQNQYSTAVTPTSEFYPTSARSGSFPDPNLHRTYHPASNHSGSSGMAQPNSPSLPLQDGSSSHQNNQIKSDQDVSIDPSIAASSPTYAHGQYSPYPPQQEMQHGYPSHQSGGMYTQPRPDWAGYAGQQQPHPMAGGYPVSGSHPPPSTATANRGGQGNQVYSFVPIPGAQQHKRPRRRYEEIERMYKCGWNGCEKAYGTLNHLNAHVTMQSHGQKRTPEEFKEIRKEWKARKKEEENQRKAEEDRQRMGVAQAGPPSEQQQPGQGAPPQGYQQQQSERNVQLPPIGYQPGGQVPAQYQAPAGGVQQLQQYDGNQMQTFSGYPASPYGAPNQMYNQRHYFPHLPSCI
ncbi:hypothetical protein HYFRA_00007257 [Hymenoscyphus fraxineus]|uniref:C2H2-type domain-containing protein n=1 Tax=Hymenoscyphus fraxineus TaxID=746836 RepID=A0A9N9KVS8_9HELO|nr:hypothetical protein HYFRA_00007257 [Hymenoscyphus fraxineus]